MECDALIVKSKIEVLYLQQLKDIEAAMHQKVKTYEKEAEQAQLYTKELESMTSEVVITATAQSQ